MLSACSTTQHVPLAEGCSIPDTPAELMSKPGPLPLLQKQVKGQNVQAGAAEVSTEKLIKGYGLMTEAAVERHNRVVALQGHLRDTSSIKRRCAAPGSPVNAKHPSTT